MHMSAVGAFSLSEMSSPGEIVDQMVNQGGGESRKPQESKIRFSSDGHPYVLRAAIVSTNFGQMAALRVLDSPKFTEFTQLGMSEAVIDKIKRNISGRYGLFLECGPTGAGKTTT